MSRRPPILIAAVVAIATGAAVYSMGGPVGKSLVRGIWAGSLSERVASAVERDLPRSDSVLTEPSPRWDALLGGRIGPGKWRYYEAGYGTTCGVTAAGWLAKAGAPPGMINRDPPEGSGFGPGAHISRLRQGAQELGWLFRPRAGQLPNLRRGDVYCMVRATSDGTSGEHVGVVLKSKRIGDSLHLVTGDGGQTSDAGKQAAKRRNRVVYPDGTVVTPGSGSATLAWWIRMGGEAIA